MRGRADGGRSLRRTGRLVEVEQPAVRGDQDGPRGRELGHRRPAKDGGPASPRPARTPSGPMTTAAAWSAPHVSIVARTSSRSVIARSVAGARRDRDVWRRSLARPVGWRFRPAAVMLERCTSPPGGGRAPSPPLLAALLILLTASVATATEFPAGRTGYHSYTEVTAEVAAVAAAHPAIVLALLDRQELQGPRHLGGQDLGQRRRRRGRARGHVRRHAPRRRAHGHRDDPARSSTGSSMATATTRGSRTSSTRARSGSSSSSTPTAPSSTSPAAGSTTGARTASRRPGPRSIGTDLNRNYSYRWGGGGRTSSNPSSHHLPRHQRRSRRPRRARCATSWPAASSTGGSRSAPRSRSTRTAGW